MLGLLTNREARRRKARHHAVRRFEDLLDFLDDFRTRIALKLLNKYLDVIPRKTRKSARCGNATVVGTTQSRGEMFPVTAVRACRPATVERAKRLKRTRRSCDVIAMNSVREVRFNVSAQFGGPDERFESECFAAACCPAS
jgi:hypothetical protein